MSDEAKNSWYRYIRFYIILLIKILLLIIVLWFVGKSLYNSIANIDWRILSFRPLRVVEGSLIIISAFFVGAYGLQYIYRHLDATLLSWPQAFVLLSVPPLGKYLPTKFFAIAGHAVIAKTFGVRMVVSGSVTFLIMGFGLASATLIGMVLLLFQLPIESNEIILRIGSAIITIVIFMLIIKPDMYWSIMNRLLPLVNQTPVMIEMGRQSMAVLFIVLLFQNGLYLLGVSIITSGIVVFSISLLPTIVGVICLANVAGFLAIFAPAGIGVREGVLLVMLTPVVGPGIAGLIAVTMRMIQTASDCIFGIIGFVILSLFQRKKNIC
jgi:glycosyltransferase 2 family protein